MMKTNTYLLGVLVMVFACISCSSPEKEAQELAKKSVDLQSKELAIKVRVREQFIDDFYSYHFCTSQEGLDKLQENYKKSLKLIEQEKNELEAEYSKIEEKYLLNKEKHEKFESSFKRSSKFYEKYMEAYNEYEKEVNSLLSAIVPPKPNLQRITDDIDGKRFTIPRYTTNHAYLYDTKIWIDKKNITASFIQNTFDRGDEVAYTVHYTCREFGKYNVDYILNISYYRMGEAWYVKDSDLQYER